MRPVFIAVLASIVSGCAYIPRDVSQVEIKARDSDIVHYGVIKRELPAVVTLTVEINRRIYSGNFEQTFPNAMFGLYTLYGRPDTLPNSSAALSRAKYAKAILTSSDQRILTCDFADYGDKDTNGLCVDEVNRVYDVVLSKQPNPA